MGSRSLLLFLILLLVFNKKLASQTFDAEVISYTTLCEVDNDKLIQTDSITIQINNRNGDKYTAVTIPYSKTEKVSNIDAWIEDMNGNKIRNLKKSDMTDKSAISDISLYEDNFIKCFQLKHNIYPYKIIYTYQTHYKNYLLISWWTPIIYNAIPTRTAKLTGILPRGFQISKYVNCISDFKTESTNSGRRLEWKSSYLKPTVAEIYSQPEIFKPYVIISPLDFNYGISGSSKNWISYGNWQYQLMQDLDDLPNDEKLTISSIINGISDKKELVKTLYHYLQDHTRYINVSIGIGGHKPYPASYVALNKYGDCKALTNYMKALLSFGGIESFYTLVNASEQPKGIINSIAGPQFNHAILAVPIGNDTIWLENTSSTNPFGYMGTQTQNRQALLVSKDKSTLVRIPALKAKENLSSFKLEFELNISGNSTINAQTSFTGEDFEILNQIQNGYNEDEKDRIFRNYLPFDNYEVIDWKLTRQQRDSARIELKAHLSISKLLKPLGDDYYLSLFPSRIPPFTVPANRHLPVILPYPLCNSDTLVYNLPDGYDLKNKLETISIKTQFGNYAIQFNVLNRKIHVIKRFELYPGSYSTDQYAELYAFIKSVTTTDKMNIVFKPHN